MNTKRMVLPGALGVLLLGVGVYFSGSDLSGDADIFMLRMQVDF